MKYLKKYNVILLIISVIFLSVMFGEKLPFEWKVSLFTISNILKEILMFTIPFLIYPFVVHSMLEIKSKAVALVGVRVVFFLLLFVFLSNFISIFIAYFLGISLIPSISVINNIQNYQVTESIYPYFSLNLWSFEIVNTLLFGILSGLFLSYFPNRFLLKILDVYYSISRTFLEKAFVFFLPPYIIGNILKVTHEIDFIALFPMFGNMLVILLLVKIFYIGFLFLIGSGIKPSKCITAIKNALPAGFVAFSTMSSLITMPITLKAAEKNTDNSPITGLTISTTVNCHDIGDCISLPLIALTILYVMTGSVPEPLTYFYFAFFLSIAQFSAISVPGGSIIVMLPLLIKYLGFSPEMASLILTLSICIEPLSTAMNVMGNSAFVILMNRLFKRSYTKNYLPQT